MAARTPVRVGSSTVWIDTDLRTVICGAVGRSRTLLAGLSPRCYLIASGFVGEFEAIVLDPYSAEGWQFTPGGGMAADVRPRTKPTWCMAIEATLPDPSERVPTWVEVGVDGYPAAMSFSIPQGGLPRLQAGLALHQRRLTYITRVSVDHDG